jgi:hypothetical protein
MQEYKFLNKLDHPNILNIREIWQWKENWYLAFLDGSPENLINKESDSVLEDVEDEESFWTFISENKYEHFKF